MSEIEFVAKRLYFEFVDSHGYPNGLPNWQDANEDIRSCWRRLAADAIQTLDGYRASEKRKNCNHLNSRGSGGTGNAEIRWHCLDCGASYTLPPSERETT